MLIQSWNEEQCLTYVSIKNFLNEWLHRAVCQFNIETFYINVFFFEKLNLRFFNRGEEYFLDSRDFGVWFWNRQLATHLSVKIYKFSLKQGSKLQEGILFYWRKNESLIISFPKYYNRLIRKTEPFLKIFLNYLFLMTFIQSFLETKWRKCVGCRHYIFQYWSSFRTVNRYKSSATFTVFL